MLALATAATASPRLIGGWRQAEVAAGRPSIVNCTWQNFTQKIDHFGDAPGTFPQRLCLYDKWWKRAFEFDAHRMVWSGNFTSYNDGACTQPASSPPYQVVQQPMALEGASSHIGYAQDAQFAPEEDIVLRTGDLLFLGARPLTGGGLTARPRAFSPALQRASGAQGPPPTTLASVAGYWQSPVSHRSCRPAATHLAT